MTIYESLRHKIQRTITNESQEGPIPLIVQDSFNNKVAYASWHLCIHGTFWLVGSDSDGKYLLPDKNNGYLKVYQALGVGDTIWSLVRNRNKGKAVCGVITVSAIHYIDSF